MSKQEAFKKLDRINAEQMTSLLVLFAIVICTDRERFLPTRIRLYSG